MSQATGSSADVYGSKGAFSLGRVDGVFTVADFRTVNGTTMAAGWLTGNVTDSTRASELGTFTNFPVRLPVSGVLSGNPIETGFINDPVILPQLSTNTCSLLGIVIGEIDVTVPGLGLNLHVNEISLVVRSDRETAIGDLLCTVLGGNATNSTPTPASLVEVNSTSGPEKKTDPKLVLAQSFLQQVIPSLTRLKSTELAKPLVP